MEINETVAITDLTAQNTNYLRLSVTEGLNCQITYLVCDFKEIILDKILNGVSINFRF